MTASRFFSPRLVAARSAARSLALASSIAAVGCAAPHRDGAASLVAITGEFRADGSCRVLVNGASLFAPSDGARTAYDSGPVADVAPAGYTLRQLTCAPAADTSPAPDRADARMTIVTLYAREGAPLRMGRYAIQAASEDDSAGAAARAGVAVFGAANVSRGAGVRYLEGREGTLTLVGVTPGADGGRVVGTFSARAGPAWSM